MISKAQLEVASKLHHAIFFVETGELTTARELAGEATDMIDRILEEADHDG